MIDELEHYIEKNRNAFDDQTPRDLVWAAVQKELDKSTINGKDVDQQKDVVRIHIPRKLLQYAAAAVLLISVSVIAFEAGRQGKVSQNPIVEMDEAQNFYKNKAEALLVQYPTLVDNQTELKQDIDELETAYLEVRQEFIERGGKSDQAIMEQMLQIYKMKIEILENAIQSTKQNNNRDEIIKM